MVCIAAFIILCLLSVFFAIIAIFRRDIGQKYWKTFKKAWGCVFTRLKFQKCESSFKEDIKNSLLKKVVIKHPKAVKPLGIGIEVAAVLIVAITIWSLVVSIRAGLSLLVFGNCDITKPDACSQSSVCVAAPVKQSFGQRFVGWFTGWGDIFAAMPDRFRRYDANQFISSDMTFFRHNPDNPSAIEIFDPGCDKCMAAFRSQLQNGFFDRHNTVMLPYPMFADGAYKYPSSGIISRYLLAAEEWALAQPAASADNIPLNWRLLARLFSEYSSDGVTYQAIFNSFASEAEAAELLDQWLADFGLDSTAVAALRTNAHSDHITAKLAERKRLAEEGLNSHGLVPITIYNGRKHVGADR